MGRSLVSTQLPEAPPWLGNVYAVRRQRTTDLVRTSIDALEKEGTPGLNHVGSGDLAASQKRRCCATPTRGHSMRRTARGEAYVSVGSTARSRKPELIRVKLDRDRGRAGQRYMRLNKGELVARLLIAERACYEYEEKWLRTADELFGWTQVAGGVHTA
jgi:hypothetical protein